MSYPITVESGGRSYVISNRFAGLFAPHWARTALEEQKFNSKVNSYARRIMTGEPHPDPKQCSYIHHRNDLEILFSEGPIGYLRHKIQEKQIKARLDRSYYPEPPSLPGNQIFWDDLQHQHVSDKLVTDHRLASPPLPRQPTRQNTEVEDQRIRRAILLSVQDHLLNKTPLSDIEIKQMLFASPVYNQNQPAYEVQVKRFTHEQKDLLQRIKDNQPLTTAYERFFK